MRSSELRDPVSGGPRTPAQVMRHFGFERFHIVGHDRGGRTGHRMAFDHNDAVVTLAVMDIVPTYAMFMNTNQRVAGAYWHWYFLSQLVL
jgi:haloacetate dehalogenase